MIKIKNKIICLTMLFMLLTLTIAQPASAATYLMSTYYYNKLIPSLGNGWETVTVNAKYKEYYTANTSTNTFYKRNVYYTVDLVNNSPDIETQLYMFNAVKHYNGSGTELANYSLNTLEPTMFPDADYFGSFSNFSSVSYSKTTACYGKSAFMVNVNGAIPWMDYIKLKLATSSSTSALSVDKNDLNTIIQNKNFFQKYGELEAKRIKNKADKDKANKDKESNNQDAADNILSENYEFIYDNDDALLLASEIELNGYSNEEAYKIASDYLQSRISEYNTAVKSGYEASDEQVNLAISKLRESIKGTDNYSDYLVFIDATGMAEDEYWNSQFSVYKQNETIKNYKKALK